MLHHLTQLLQSANPGYTVQYEEAAMMNIKGDELDPCTRFVYIEEFVRGKYTLQKYKGYARQMRMQIYFCRFTPFHNDAIQREQQRQEIITQIVEPFITQYNQSPHFDHISDWTLNYPLPRFDANEISVMLEFDCTMPLCELKIKN